MIRLILAEDHTIVRNGLSLILNAFDTIEVVAEFSNAEAVLAGLSQGLQADMLLTDVNMAEMDGISLCKEVKTLYPGLKVVILSMIQSEAYVAQAFAQGADGYLLKSIDNTELHNALSLIHSGYRYLCAELMQSQLSRFQQAELVASGNITIHLSAREQEVLEHIALGLTNQEIADKLFLSKRTVEGHREILLQKTGAKNTAALIIAGVRQGLLK